MHRLIPLIFLAPILGACPANHTTDTESSHDADGSSSGETTSAATTEDPADETSGTTDTGDDPTGGTSDACADRCARLAACGDPEAEDCADRCARDTSRFQYIGDGCLALFADYNECLAALSCDELAQPDACVAADMTLASEACTTQVCRDLCDTTLACEDEDPDGLGCRIECSFADADAFVEIGPDCSAAREATEACLAALSCAEFDQPDSCAAEMAAESAACE